jgi:hypothetical protein
LTLLALERTATDDDKPEVDDNAQTIRPNRSPGGSGPIPLAKAPAADIVPIVEDYSDLAADEDDIILQEKVADFKVGSLPFVQMVFPSTSYNLQMKNSVRRGLFHPDDIKTLGISPGSPGPMSAPLPGLSRKTSRPSLSPAGPTGPNGPTAGSMRSHSRSSSFVGSGSSASGSFGRSDAKRVASSHEFDKYAEEDDEDYDDVFGKVSGTSE